MSTTTPNKQSVKKAEDTIVSVWCCPQCRGTLQYAESTETVVRCRSCAETYPVYDGVLDLRLPGESWIDYEEDRALAQKFLREADSLTLEEQLAWCFGARGTFTPEQIRIRVGQVISAVENLGDQIDEWLAPSLKRGGLNLDLGCGPGQLIAAASKRGFQMVGIDVRLLWLLAAKRLITAFGGTPILAAALAEQMPIADKTVDAVVSLDVIEHVADVPQYLREINRVTANGATVAFSTPNRFSLAAEPHVGVWGVGWVPRPWQAAYVMMRKGIPYPYTCLLSVPETCNLITKHTQFRPTVLVPKVPAYEVARFPGYRRLLATIYNAVAPWQLFRLPLLAVGPFFRVIGKKPG